LYTLDKPFQKPRLESQIELVSYVTQRMLDQPNGM